MENKGRSNALNILRDILNNKVYFVVMAAVTVVYFALIVSYIIILSNSDVNQMQSDGSRVERLVDLYRLFFLVILSLDFVLKVMYLMKKVVISKKKVSYEPKTQQNTDDKSNADLNSGSDINVDDLVSDYE